MIDLHNIKLPYNISIIIVIIVIIITLSLYKIIMKYNKEIENFIKKEIQPVKLKTQQCENCELIGNPENSFLEIYKKSKN